MNQKANELEKAFVKAVSEDDFFVLRTANQSFDVLRQWQGGDTKQLRAQLNRWLEQDEVIEALYVASPSIVERIPYWQKDPDSKRGRKIEAVLVKYFIRMTSRSTPFGLFASVGFGQMQQASSLDLSDNLTISRKTRMDMGFLADRQHELVKDKAVLSQLILKPNQSLYKMDSQWRFIESDMHNRKRHYRLSNAESDFFLDFVLNQAKENTATLNDLAQAICQQDNEIALNEAIDYVTSLVEEQLLVPELSLNLTGESPDSQFVETLNHWSQSRDSEILSGSVEALARLDKTRVNKPQDYEAIIESLKTLDSELNRDKLFQVDSFKRAQSLALSKKVTGQLKRDLAKLYRITAKSRHPFKDFIGRFNERFEGKAVPLSVLLDDEVGIGQSGNKGFESPLIGTLPFNAGEPENNTQSLNWSALDAMLLNKIMQNAGKGEEIELTDADLSKFESPSVNALPASFSLMTTLFAKDKNALDEGEFTALLGGCAGPSAAKMLGRFCHLDPQLTEHVRAHLKKEEATRPDAIFAEIVHLPQGRVGNVIARPVLRDYEIPFLSSSGVAEAFQIAIDDLWVFVHSGRLVLWSKRLNKEIIPRLSCAHNYRNQSLGIYHFLCQMQSYNCTLPHFKWSQAFAQMPYLPRVRIGKLICALQTWRLPMAELKAFKPLTDAEFVQKMSTFREHYGLPRFVSYAVGDNSLQVDLNNILAVNTLIGELKGGDSVSVTEVLAESLPLAVSQDGQPLHHEILIPFNTPSHTMAVGNVPHRFESERKFEQSHAPGGDWLMLKIYTGNSTCDVLIRDILTPMIAKQLEQTPCKTWFFMRYGDPDWHLRLRFNGEAETLYGVILPKVHQLLKPMHQQGLISKIELATYDRELVRYGGEHAIALSERYFQYDSECCAQLLQVISDEGADVRWQCVLLGVYHILQDFGFNREDIHRIVKDYRATFGREFKETALLRKAMGKKYRLFDNFLQQLVLSELNEPLWQRINALFTERREKSASLVGQMRALEVDKLLSVSLERVVKSYLHMFMNRMFVSNARKQELIVYDFLDKILTFAKFSQPK